MTDSRPRVLVLATTVPAVPGDGTPEFVLDLSRGLARSYRVTLLAPRVPGAPMTSTVDGVEIVRFGYLPRRWETLADGAIIPNLRARPLRSVQVPFLVFAFTRHALRSARRLRPDATHAHWILPAGPIAWLLRKRRGTPYIITVHGSDAFSMNGRILRRLKRVVLRGAAFVGPVSADVASVLPYDHPSTEVIPMGIPLEQYQGTSPTMRREADFLFVGRLAEKKGVDVLIRAIKEVEDAHLTVAGDGPDGEALRSLAETMGVASRVTFLGRVEREALPDLYGSATAIVMPSVVATDGDKDGTPLVMSEAMAAGAPIVASDLGGLGEYIDDGINGLLVRPGSVDDLRIALRRAIDSPAEMASMGARAREAMAGGPLDAQTTGTRYSEVLKRLIEG